MREEIVADVPGPARLATVYTGGVYQPKLSACFSSRTSKQNILACIAVPVEYLPLKLANRNSQLEIHPEN